MLDRFKIVSGGQTGADRAASEFAIAHSIPHGGCCPKGPRAADSPVDSRCGNSPVSKFWTITRTRTHPPILLTRLKCQPFG
jgi:hypothetical protein